MLSSVSDYFAAMFTNDVREARQEEIKMEGVEPNSLWSLIQYAYTGNKSENKQKPFRLMYFDFSFDLFSFLFCICFSNKVSYIQADIELNV